MTYFRFRWCARCAGAAKGLAIVMSLALHLPGANAGTIPADDAVVLAVLPTAVVRHREFSSAASPRDVAATLQQVRAYLDADADSGTHGISTGPIACSTRGRCSPQRTCQSEF